MASPALKRAAWIAGATIAVAAIVLLAGHGRRPEPGLVGFAAAGVMADVAPERITSVSVSHDGRRREFTRDGERGWALAPGAAATPDVTERIEAGLRFLHASAPQRVMAREELAGTSLSDLGLDPPRHTIVVREGSRAVLTLEFGALNPQGLAQYARVTGREDQVLLLPSFVGEPWAALTADR